MHSDFAVQYLSEYPFIKWIPYLTPVRCLFVILALFLAMMVNAQADDPTERFFFKLDYGLSIPLGSFSEFQDLEDGYALLGHGGSLSGGFHLDDRWSLAISVQNILNKVDRVMPYDFNDRRNYQFFSSKL